MNPIWLAHIFSHGLNLNHQLVGVQNVSFRGFSWLETGSHPYPYSAPVIPCEVWCFRHQFSPRVKKGSEHKGHIFLGVDDVRFLGDVSIKTFKLPIWAVFSWTLVGCFWVFCFWDETLKPIKMKLISEAHFLDPGTSQSVFHGSCHVSQGFFNAAQVILSQWPIHKFPNFRKGAKNPTTKMSSGHVNFTLYKGRTSLGPGNPTNSSFKLKLWGQIFGHSEVFFKDWKIIVLQKNQSFTCSHLTSKGSFDGLSKAG